jgi:hypothetical protein
LVIRASEDRIVRAGVDPNEGSGILFLIFFIWLPAAARTDRAPRVEFEGLPGPEAFRELLGETRGVRRGAERLLGENGGSLVVLSSSFALERE